MDGAPVFKLFFDNCQAELTPWSINKSHQRLFFNKTFSPFYNIIKIKPVSKRFSWLLTHRKLRPWKSKKNPSNYYALVPFYQTWSLIGQICMIFKKNLKRLMVSPGFFFWFLNLTHISQNFLFPRTLSKYVYLRGPDCICALSSRKKHILFQLQDPWQFHE